LQRNLNKEFLIIIKQSVCSLDIMNMTDCDKNLISKHIILIYLNLYVLFSDRESMG